MNVRIYVEGGGNGANSKAALRQGFEAFFHGLREMARSRRKECRIITCGGRDAAFKLFRNALKDHADAFNILLVDSEEAVSASPKEHLQNRDKWDLRDVREDQCHLMVQTMEAWLIADKDALARFYGQNFQPSALPATPNVEQIEKPVLSRALNAATRRTQKGEYHKIQHGPKILAIIDASKVCAAAPHCERLFSTIEQKLK